MTEKILNRRVFLERTALAGSAAALTLSTGCVSPVFSRASAKYDPLIPPPPEDRIWRTTGLRVESLTDFDANMKVFMVERNITTASFALTYKSRLITTRGYCWNVFESDVVWPDTQFRIASLSKPITAAGVLRLVQDGQLNLGDKLVDLIDLTPVLAGESPDPRLAQITVLHLLQHQGGWDVKTSFDPMFRDVKIAEALGVNLPIDRSQIIAYMAGRPLDFDPGTRYAYSNFGYLLLGRILEARSGLAYDELIRRAVLAPLGMNKTVLARTAPANRRPKEAYYYDKDPNPRPNVLENGAPVNAAAPYGAWNIENMDSHGGWLSTSPDMARFAAVFDPTGSCSILSPEIIETAFAPPAAGRSADGSYYGCGWRVRPAGDSRNTWHTGSLPGTYAFMARRHDGLNLVALFNQRADQSGLSYSSIDPLLNEITNNLVRFPEHDLFPDCGLAPGTA